MKTDCIRDKEQTYQEFTICRTESWRRINNKGARYTATERADWKNRVSMACLACGLHIVANGFSAGPWPLRHLGAAPQSRMAPALLSSLCAWAGNAPSGILKQQPLQQDSKHGTHQAREGASLSWNKGNDNVCSRAAAAAAAGRQWQQLHSLWPPSSPPNGSRMLCIATSDAACPAFPPYLNGVFDPLRRDRHVSIHARRV